MCKINLVSGNKRIDPCMRFCIRTLDAMSSGKIKVVACCCGHGVYKKTIVVENERGDHWELLSGQTILRKKRFYFKDKKGRYYIPEVENGS